MKKGDNTQRIEIRLRGQAVKTLASHAGIRGSIPLGVICKALETGLFFVSGNQEVIKKVIRHMFDYLIHKKEEDLHVLQIPHITGNYRKLLHSRLIFIRESIGFFMPIYIATPYKGVAITISVKGGNYLQCRNAR